MDKPTLDHQESLVTQLACMGIDDEGNFGMNQALSSRQLPLIIDQGDQQAASRLHIPNSGLPMHKHSPTHQSSSQSFPHFSSSPHLHADGCCGSVVKNRADKLARLQNEVEAQLEGLHNDVSSPQKNNHKRILGSKSAVSLSGMGLLDLTPSQGSDSASHMNPLLFQDDEDNSSFSADYDEDGMGEEDDNFEDDDDDGDDDGEHPNLILDEFAVNHVDSHQYRHAHIHSTTPPTPALPNPSKQDNISSLSINASDTSQTSATLKALDPDLLGKLNSPDSPTPYIHDFEPNHGLSSNILVAVSAHSTPTNPPNGSNSHFFNLDSKQQKVVTFSEQLGQTSSTIKQTRPNDNIQQLEITAGQGKTKTSPFFEGSSTPPLASPSTLALPFLSDTASTHSSRAPRSSHRNHSHIHDQGTFHPPLHYTQLSQIVPKNETQEYLHQYSDATAQCSQNILSIISPAPKLPVQTTPSRSIIPGSRTAATVAVDEVHEGVKAIDEGRPKPIPTFTRAHFNTNWITSDIYTSTPRQRYAISTKPFVRLPKPQAISTTHRPDPTTLDLDQLDEDYTLKKPKNSDLDEDSEENLDDSVKAQIHRDYEANSLVHTFYSPNQPRAIVDDTFDPEKQAVSTMFLNCLKLRREFLFTPAFVDRRSFNILETPEYTPPIDGTTVIRPQFETLVTTSTTTSVVTQDDDHSTPGPTLGHKTPPKTITPRNSSEGPCIASPRGNYAPSPRANQFFSQKATQMSALHNIPYQNATFPPKQTKLVTTTTTTLNPDVFCHINQALSTELINHPENFVYGFVNGVVQIHRRDTMDIIKTHRQRLQDRKQQIVPPAVQYPHLFASNSSKGASNTTDQGLNTSGTNNSGSNSNPSEHHSHHPHLTPAHRRRLMKQQDLFEKQQQLDEEIDKHETKLETNYPGYVRDIYHISLHQQRTYHNEQFGLNAMNSARSESSTSMSPQTTPQIQPQPQPQLPPGPFQNPNNLSTNNNNNNNNNPINNTSTMTPFKPASATALAQTQATTNNQSQGMIHSTSFTQVPSIFSNFSQLETTIPHHFDPNLNNLIPVPTWSDFCDALAYILRTATDGPCKSWAYNRLTMLETQKSLHSHLNQDLERVQSKSISHRDFYNVRKIDNHVHHSACMNQKHFLRFIKRKLREPEATTVPVISRDGKDLTLDEVFKSLNLTAYDLSIDTLDMHASQTFHRFDKFNAKYSPINETRLREIFLKYQNKINGLYLAEITKEVFEDLQINKYQFAEYRISIYGRSLSEWDALADWIVDFKLTSPNVRWMIQTPRLYSVYKRAGSIRSFQDMLTNIFLPLFHVTLYPHSNPKLHQLLSLIVGFDTVDDESVRTKFFDKATNPPPQKWTSEDDPHYCVFMYYLYANLRVLNHLRELLGLNTFALRPHAGEAGDIEHVAATFLTSKGINHGLTLFRTPPVQYLYYLAQVGISMSPLSNNLLFLEYPKNPFPRFFHRGLNVTLSTDDPLMIHMTKEPLIEEYAIASQTWGLSHIDLCEIARNSVLQSGFEHPFKAHWLGNNYYRRSGTESNDIRMTNVPDIRVQLRWEILYTEHLLLSSYATHSNIVDVSLIDPIY